jgi:hypothetical protein
VLVTGAAVAAAVVVVSNIAAVEAAAITAVMHLLLLVFKLLKLLWQLFLQLSGGYDFEAVITDAVGIVVLQLLI